jgi:[2-(trimethylamino)ethyl]phosphonate dioxygenase
MMTHDKQSHHHVQSADLLSDGQVAELAWTDGTRARFHSFWLQDNNRASTHRDPVNGQRLTTLADIDSALRLVSVNVEGGSVEFDVSQGREGLTFDSDWLYAHRYDFPTSQEPGWLNASLTVWDGSAERIPHAASFVDLAGSRDALGGWLEAFHADGVALMRGGPTHDGAVCDLASLFAYVRETNYGRLFDVKSVVDPVNLAFSRLGLAPHTDNPYRDQQPTLQLLYCLENSADGGESIVVDGFKAAHLLRDESPENFALLSGYCARYEYAGSADVHLTSKRPMIELAPDGELTAVSMNNRSVAALTDISFEDMPRYYDAYRAFEEILARPSLAVQFKLEPGECFMVDNTRVMHSRQPFSSGGERWLQGCYADRETLRSTLSKIKRGEAS